ncbi:MAG: PQQ-binding-like beta-propeller repeat protein [Bacteroidetes bacterium]|nr:PQQ-binding-like beta-propeller repeat protein [Bacteroidota bacterium]
MAAFLNISISIIFILITGLDSVQGPSPSWTHFRGDNLNGISTETNIPVSWNDTVNIEWRTAIDGKGWSSPVVLGEQVWLTTATGDNKEMRALCVDFTTGALIHNRTLFKPDSLYRIHAINSYATPTGAIEKGRVYLHFGRYGTACLNTGTGESIWERTDMQVEHIQGPGSSLLIFRDKLIVHMEGSDFHYIVALDKKSGKTIWKTERPKELYDKLEYIGKKAYITPIIVNVKGRDLMISNGSAACIAYDPETGKEVWRIVYGEDSTIAMPTESDGIVYYYVGFETDSAGEKHAKLMAVNPEGEGEIEETNVLWSVETPILQLLSPLVLDGLLYTIDSRGVMLCLDASDGTSVWSKKMKGKFHSSPLYADGHIYFNSTRGYTYVIKEGRKLNVVSENRLEGEIWATPAIAGGAILMRTSKYLYKITNP